MAGIPIGIGLGSSLIGCTPSASKESSPDAASSVQRSDVPLRIVWVGTPAHAEVLNRSWGAISEQPLEIQIADPTTEDLLTNAENADILVFPLMQLAEIVDRDLAMPLLASKKKTNSFNRTPAALEVAVQYAGEPRAVSLGGHLPSVLTGESIEAPSLENFSWQDYDVLVDKADGLWAEPCGGSWAAAMYLWRLASSLETSWLFDRKTMEPLIARPEYKSVLTRMLAVTNKCKATSLEPHEIWHQVSQGKLLGGIGFPNQASPELDLDDTSDESSVAITIRSIPQQLETTLGDDNTPLAAGTLKRLMIDPFASTACLAQSCRQTAAANQFLNWLGGGEGSQSLYRNIDAIIDVRSPSRDNATSEERYRNWLRNELKTPTVVPAMQLVGSRKYYDTMNENVQACLNGALSPDQACSQIAERWSELHREFDIERQRRCWQRTQGIG